MKKKKKARPTRAVQHGEEEKDKEKKREKERMRAGRGPEGGGEEGEESREGRRRPMAARSFFVMIVILESDRPRAFGPVVGATATRFLTRLMADPTVNIATLIRRWRGRATEDDVLLPQFDMHAASRSPSSVCLVFAGERCGNEQNCSDSACSYVSCASDANCSFIMVIQTLRDRRELMLLSYIGLFGHLCFWKIIQENVRKKMMVIGKSCEYAIGYVQIENPPSDVNVWYYSTVLFCMINL